MFDLHCHSYYSDGLLSPKDLVQRAVNANIHYLALTDHDSIEGCRILQEAAVDWPVQIISGIELSVCWKKYDIHILGLGVDVSNAGLLALIDQQNEQRIARAIAIGDALGRCGLNHAYQEACELAGHKRIGRAHYAQLLIKKGFVKEPRSAFTQYLGRGKVAYVPSNWINLSGAVTAIVEASGQAVIAHPVKYGLTNTKLQELIKAFKLAGGVGMEVVSGDMMDKDIQAMAKLCHKFELLASSGSDFHGDGMSRVALGRQKALPNSCKPIWHTWDVSHYNEGSRDGSDFCVTS